MSDTHAAPEGHEGPIKTVKQLVWAVIAAFVVPIALIVLFVNYVAFGNQPAAGSQALDAEAVAMRLQPLARIEIKDASDIASLKTGEQVVQAQCSACHTSGAAGAPKVGDTAAWAPRIATGLETLVKSALAGKGAMAAQGGGDFSDFEIQRAVVYLANQSGAKFEEPKAPAGAASGAASAAK